MVDVIWSDLTGKLNEIGPLRFLRAEWWKEAPRFVLLRYTLHGKEIPNGIRMDLDKQVILDSVGDEQLDARLFSQRASIWQAITCDRQSTIMRSIHNVPPLSLLGAR